VDLRITLTAGGIQHFKTELMTMATLAPARLIERNPSPTALKPASKLGRNASTMCAKARKTALG
jgi:hypothetical protein